MMPNEKVTIAICTWNRANLLDETLNYMRKLRIPAGLEWELLVIDNNCTDHTEAVVAKHSDALPIRRQFEPTPGLSNARNRAIEEARGDLILWTDDDVLVDAGWLEAFAAAARRHPEAGAFGGPIEPWFPIEPDPDLLQAFPELRVGFCGYDLVIGEGPVDDHVPVVGANMAHRVALLGDLRFNRHLGMSPIASQAGKMAVGGFEEIDLNDRLRTRGHRVVWVPTMRVQHYVDPSRLGLDYLRHYVVEHGRQSVRLGDVHPRSVSGTKNILGIPRWLLRAVCETRVRSALYWFRSQPVESLIQLRQSFYYRGILQACWSDRRAGSARQ